MPDPDDRHVLAAAIHAHADLIVTFNLSDFSAEILQPLNIQAQHPDEFVTRLLDLEPGTVCLAAKRHRTALKNPPKTVEEYLATLARLSLPQTVLRLQGFADRI